MLVKPDCIPCILKMSIDLLRRLPISETEFNDLFVRILDIPELRGRRRNKTSPEIIERIMLLMMEKCGPDPFASEKARMNEMAEAMMPAMEERIAGSAEPLNLAFRIAMLGNAIDFMMSDKLSEIETLVIDRLETPVSSTAYTRLLEKLKNSRTLVYLTDNAGEIVFDRLLMETLKVRYPDLDLYCIVRKMPALNDATKAEALSVGLDGQSKLFDNGIDGPLPGTLLHRCSDTVKGLLERADLIISKGGGNFDTLSEDLKTLNTDVTFMLLSKCHPYREFFDTDLYQPVLYNAYNNNPQQ